MAVSAPPTQRPPDTLPPLAIDTPRRWSITVEHALYVLIALAAVLTHLVALGDRALHHDETLHAAYSWRIYQNQGYQHDPLLHGPFLYYITAFVYLLLGDTDWTARLSAALFGIGLVLLPWLLRRDLGRGTALLASASLLISPVTLYVGRFLRHDIFAVVFELLSVIAILRYVATERPLWHYTLAAAMGLMLATMETFYLFLLIVGSFVMIWALWHVARRALWLLAAYAAIVVVALRGVTRVAGPLPLPTPEQALLVRNRPDNNLLAYFADVIAAIGPMLLHPAGLIVIASSILLLVALLWIVFWRRGADGRSAWRRAADNAPVGTLVGALDRIGRRQWAIAFGIAVAIYAVFYTALLSNPGSPNIAGLVTGVTGSFLYWLGQHGVERGAQPDHFYLFLLAVYEPLLLLFGPIGIALVIRRFLHAWRSPKPDPALDPIAIHRGLFAPALLGWWTIGALLIYSWAGEKMPWLTIHIALPLTLLSAWALARLWQWATRDGFDSVALLITAMAGVLIVLCFNRFSNTILLPDAVRYAAIWPVLAITFVALMVAGIGVLYRSARPATLALLSLVLAFGTVFTIRSSVRLAFINGDVPVEPMVFVQTSPDVPRALDDLRRASILRAGGPDLPILYDNETIWDWYLRNYTQTDGSRGDTFGPIPEDVQAIFMLAENVAKNEAQLDGFVRQQYPLRWWFPECAVYRFPTSDPECRFYDLQSSLLSRLLTQPFDGQTLADNWRFWFERKVPAPLGSTDWTLFVRPELAAEFGIGAGVTP